MATFWTIPKGPLVSFGSHTFISNRSILQGDWSLETTPEMIALVNSFDEADLAGFATLSAHGIYTWQYDVLPVTGNATAVQDEITALITAWRTQNGDGTTGQVATLTVKLLGYSSTKATAKARLVSVKSLATYSTREKLALQFTCPQGFTYTA